MQKILAFVLSIITLVTSTIGGWFGFDKEPSDFTTEIINSQVEKISECLGFANDTIIVFVKDSATYKEIKKLAKEIDGKIVGFSSFFKEYQIKIGKAALEDLSNLCKKLMEKAEVTYACPMILVNAKECLSKEMPEIPNDPYDTSYRDDWDEDDPYGSNWHLEAIQALSAWKYSDKMSTIDLGIVDSGFYLDHEDLQGKIFFANKYLKYTNNADSHGTHVAGIISANQNNGVGVCGVCPNARLHCVDWDPTYKSLSQIWITGERILSGLYLTVKSGAKVVNFSLGFDLIKGTHAYPKFIIDIVGGFVSAYMAVLIKNGYDFIACQAAGNGDDEGYAVNADSNGFFCSVNEKNCMSEYFGVDKNEVLDRIIVVGSAVKFGSKQFEQVIYSNVGENVDICAPGYRIYSTDNPEHNYYSYKSGTSMATPVVVGVCGLVWSIDSSFTGPEVKKIVCDVNNTCYDVPATPEYQRKYDDVDYHDSRLVNAKLSVESAIKISDSKK